MNKKKILAIVLSFSFLIIYSQNFPPPRNLFVYFEWDSVYMRWEPPNEKSFSHYNIYKKGLEYGVPVFIGSTTDTFYTTPLPIWAYTGIYEVSAAYVNPIGESEHIWSEFICLWGWILPQTIDFEECNVYRCGLGSNIITGQSDWNLIDSVSFSSSHSALFISDTIGSKAMLFTTVIGIISGQDPVLSFEYKIPLNNLYSDTLKLYYCAGNPNYFPWIPFSYPITGSNNWEHFKCSLQSLPNSFHFGFEAIYGGGSGIYLDDIKFFDKLVSIDDKILSEDLDFNIYPNPAKESFILTNMNKFNSPVIMKITNSYGYDICTKHYNSFNIDTKIDVSYLPNGIYFITIKASNISRTKKIIVYH